MFSSTELLLLLKLRRLNNRTKCISPWLLTLRRGNVFQNDKFALFTGSLMLCYWLHPVRRFIKSFIFVQSFITKVRYSFDEIVLWTLIISWWNVNCRLIQFWPCQFKWKMSWSVADSTRTVLTALLVYEWTKRSSRYLIKISLTNSSQCFGKLDWWINIQGNRVYGWFPCTQVRRNQRFKCFK